MKILCGLVLAFGLLVCSSGYEVLPASSAQTSNGRSLVVGQSVQMDWSLNTITVCFTGSSTLLVSASDTGTNQFEVIVNAGSDDHFIRRLNLTAGPSAVYVLTSTADRSKTYDVSLVKRTEALVGIVTFNSFEIDDSAKFVQCRSPVSRKMEVFADSLSCAYGVEGTPPCPYTVGTQNALESFQTLTAMHFGAELHMECWSGKGVVRNYGDANRTSVDPLPVYADRTLGNVNASDWKFPSWIPELVVIELGDNDYSTQPTPYDNVFEQGYFNLYSRIRSAYGPRTYIIAALGTNPLAPKTQVLDVVHKIQQSDKRFGFVDLHCLTEPSDFGCAGHPSVSGQKKMSLLLIEEVNRLGVWLF
eukprot:ANDGO_03797.mRNA.1 Cellulase/esterase CelE